MQLAPMFGPLKEHSAKVSCVAVSLDGKHLAAGYHDGVLLVWDANTGQVIAGPFREHTRTIYSLALSPKEHCIISGSGDRMMKINFWE